MEIPLAGVLIGYLLFGLGLVSADVPHPLVVQGGLSPDEKLSVVVREDIEGTAGPFPTGDEVPYLRNVKAGKIIGPLQEVDTMAGGFGTVLHNVRAFWSSDSRFLAMDFRSGRLNNSVVIYRLEPLRKTWRAVPQKLPDKMTGPNAAVIFAHVFHRANEGVEAYAWLSPTEISLIEYGLMPPDPPGIAGNYFNDDGEIEIIYSYVHGRWTISTFKKPPISGTPERPMRDD
jgi:hypothetical protein